MARTKVKVAAADPRQARTRTAVETPAAPKARRQIEPGALIANNQSARALEAAEAAELVTVLIPKDFRLTLDNHSPVEYKAGIDEMPVEHLNHWYVRAQGVEAYNPKAKQL